MNAGTTLGHYRILEPLGAGGMGEVYVAEDTKLHRKVALKVLPPGLAGDPERRKRFEREARTVAALNHPGIVTIYSVEEEQGVLFLTMELVDGRPLKDTIPKSGAPIDVLLRTGLGMAEALAFAHKHGIVHRDLKPANVMVTSEGRIKVLDFGLAKLREVESAAATDMSTRMMGEDLTGEGRIIGTVAYMSPEQAEGSPTDHRSDIFSLGVILHEMATGERPFKGDTDISLLSAILKDTPPSVGERRPDLPQEFARAVRRCLAKDPVRRYQSAQDLHNDLEELRQEVTSGITAARAKPAPRRRVPVAAIAVVAVLLLAAAAGAAWMWLGRGAGETQLFVADRFTRLTDSGQAFMAELSRDGRYVVHVKEENGQFALWMRQTATTSDVRIVPPIEGRFDGVSFSPDGTFVYYVVYPPNSGVGTLYRVAALGGAPVRILEDVDSAPSFSPDGTQFSFMRGEPAKGIAWIMTANLDGTGARQVAAPEPPSRFPNETAPWSPAGPVVVQAQRTLQNGVARAELQAIDVASGRMTPFGGPWLVINDIDWMPDGRSVIVSGIDAEMQEQHLWQVSYPAGERHRVTAGTSTYSGVSVGGGGRLLATIESQGRSNLWVYPFKGGTPRQLTSRTRGTVGGGGIAWTPDRRLVYTEASGNAGNQLWIMNADGTGAAQLTSGQGFAANPEVSADGRWVYYNGGSGVSSIYRIPVAGGNPQQITKGPSEFRPKVSADGKWVYYTSSAEGRNRLMKAPAEGGTPVALSPPELGFNALAIAPDGSFLLGSAWHAEGRRTSAATFSVATGEVKFIADLPPTTVWSRDGKSWLYIEQRGSAPGIYFKPEGGVAPRRVADLQGEDVWGGAVSHDEQLMALVRGQTFTDVVLIKAK